jgi:caa(3)-type oxidase subunit IV
MSHESQRPQNGFADEARSLALGWFALLVLMSTSLASAYLPLGTGNAVAGVAIAVVKTGIVAWSFMQLRRASAATKVAAAAGIAALLVLIALSSVDDLTRAAEPARWQSPHQLEPAFAAKPSR